MASSSSTSLLLSKNCRQLMCLDFPKVSLSGRKSVLRPPSSVYNDVKNTRDPCFICDHRPSSRDKKNCAVTLSPNRLSSVLAMGTSDDGAFVFCSVCLDTVGTLLRLQEEVEDIRVRIKGVLKLRGKLVSPQQQMSQPPLVITVLVSGGGGVDLRGDVNVGHHSVKVDDGGGDDESDDDSIFCVSNAAMDDEHGNDDNIITPPAEDPPSSLPLASTSSGARLQEETEMEMGVADFDDLSEDIPISCSASAGSGISVSLKSDPQNQSLGAMEDSGPTPTKAPNESGSSSKVPHHQCHICGKVYKTPSSLWSHTRAEHQAKKIDLPPYSVRRVDVHGVPWYVCPVVSKCNGKAFPKMSLLTSHLQEVHLLNPSKKQVCGVCGRRFNKPELFAAHTHPDKEDPKNIAYTCGLCGRSIKTPEGLKTHMDLVHMRKRACQCAHCGSTFSAPSGLSKHSRSCSRDTLTCSIAKCSKAFPSLEARLDHERCAHGGQTCTKCYFCSKILRRPDNFERHLRAHTLERPFPCLECGQEFPSPGELKAHALVVCGVDKGKKEEVRKRRRGYARDYRARMSHAYACDLCEQRFPRKESLMGHRKREHFSGGPESERAYEHLLGGKNPERTL